MTRGTIALIYCCSDAIPWLPRTWLALLDSQALSTFFQWSCKRLVHELWGYKFIIIHRSGVIIQVGTTQSIYEVVFRNNSFFIESFFLQCIYKERGKPNHNSESQVIHVHIASLIPKLHPSFSCMHTAKHLVLLQPHPT